MKGLGFGVPGVLGLGVWKFRLRNQCLGVGAEGLHAATHMSPGANFLRHHPAMTFATCMPPMSTIWGLLSMLLVSPNTRCDTRTSVRARAYSKHRILCPSAIHMTDMALLPLLLMVAHVEYGYIDPSKAYMLATTQFSLVSTLFKGFWFGP